MKRLRKKRLKGEKGQAMVEFALVLPIFLLIICGILDFGWMFYNQLSLDNACREGARYACVNSTKTTTEIETHIINSCNPYISNDLDISIAYTVTANPTSGDVNVTITSEMVILTPVMSIIVGGTTKTLVSTVIMKVET